MQQVIQEIFITLGIIIPLIDWTNVLLLIGSVFPFGSSLLDYLTALKSATGYRKVYSLPIPKQSRRIRT